MNAINETTEVPWFATPVERHAHHFCPRISNEMIEERFRKEREESAARLRKSTQQLVDVMIPLGIEGVEAQFNGSGDSGEVEYACLVKLNEERTALQAAMASEATEVAPTDGHEECWDEVTDEAAYFGAMAPSEFPLDGDEQGCAPPPEEVLDKLKKDMMNLTYEILSVHRSGWEIDDGAYGSVRLTANGRVVCDYTQRYTAEEDNSFTYRNKDDDDDR